MNWGVVVAAGGRAEPELAAVMGADHKALARFGGTTSLERTLSAVQGAGLARVVTVGPDSLVEAVCHGKWIQESDSALENVMLGVNHLGAEAILMIPADTPAFTPEGIAGFIRAIEARALPGDWFAAAATPLPEFKRMFPEAPVQSVKLKEGRFVVSGMYAATPDAFRRAVDAIRPLIGARKSQLQVIARIGPRAIFKYLLGTLSVRDVEWVAGRMLGAPGILVPDAHPATCLDFDTIADYHAVRAILERTEPTTVRVDST